MSKFDAFMAQNAEKLENKEVIITSRFKTDGKAMPFTIRAISANENDELQRASYVNTTTRNGVRRDLDQVKYTAKLMAASVVYPDLTDAELQDSYGVKTPEDLLRKMLYLAEYNKLAEEVSRFSNVEGLVEMVEEAKN